MENKIFKLLITIFVFSILNFSCKTNELTPEKVKNYWGKFENGQTIKFKPVDLQNTPIYEKIAKNGEFIDEYKFMDSVNVYSMVHFSDSLYITGLIVMPKKEGKYPCLIFNRGGNRELGSLIVATAVDFMAPLASKGYIIAATNYRGAPGCEGQDEFGGKDINDVLNLINSLSEIPQADTSKIGMYGFSRGGMMTYLAASYTDKLKAIAVVGGISDLFLLMKDRPEFEKEVYKQLIPDYSTNKESSLKSRSAVFFAQKMSKTTPVLILHGADDDRVSVEHSKNLDKKLTEFNIPHKLIVYENSTHGIKEKQKEVINEILNWFDLYLKNE